MSKEACKTCRFWKPEVALSEWDEHRLRLIFGLSTGDHPPENTIEGGIFDAPGGIFDVDAEDEDAEDDDGMAAGDVDDESARLADPGGCDDDDEGGGEGDDDDEGGGEGDEPFDTAADIRNLLDNTPRLKAKLAEFRASRGGLAHDLLVARDDLHAALIEERAPLGWTEEERTAAGVGLLETVFNDGTPWRSVRCTVVWPTEKVMEFAQARAKERAARENHDHCTIGIGVLQDALAPKIGICRRHAPVPASGWGRGLEIVNEGIFGISTEDTEDRDPWPKTAATEWCGEHETEGGRAETADRLREAHDLLVRMMGMESPPTPGDVHPYAPPFDPEDR